TQIFELQREYQKLSDTLENKYPDYYQLKYNIEVATVEDLQQQLIEKEETLLEYFVGKKNVYIFVITSTDIKIHTIPNNDTLKKHFEALLNTLKISPSKASNKKQAYLSYLYSAHWIYKNLVKKALPPKNTIEDIGQLIVIPDGIMGYIPFEVFLMEYPNNTDKILFDLNHLDYLIEEYSISYAYSSSLLLEGLQNEKESSWHKKENYVGFAPVFEQQENDSPKRKKGSCLASELEELEESEEEVKKLGKKMNGMVFLKEEATKENFMNYAPNKRILHLATHACLSQADPMSNTIHFVNDYLLTSELFNIRLDADLAILSACNTGSGILSPGEGIMSLSRGFLYAGCPSIITSLWSVNDKAAADIVLNLHDNLLEGQSKNDALRSAKLQYMESVPNRLRAPYFWGAFVHIGNPKPIEWNFPSKGFGWLIGFILVLSSIGFYLFKINSKKTP
ncbi:MAG: CHAT domain-containing protein, partial [Chitinophagales bacterium]